MKRAIGLIVTVCLLVSASAPAKTQSLEGTLKKVKETATITIGHRDSSIPLSYLDDKLQPIGFSIELCKHVVEAVRTKLGMPNLNVKYNPVTSATRLPLVANGTVDIECGSTANMTSRRSQVGSRPVRRLRRRTQREGRATAGTASMLTVRLLGHFDLRSPEGIRCDLGSHKAEELFAFLVLRRGRPCGRDYVADLLWEDGSAQSRKYLRQALWQVNRGLAAANLENLLSADHEWLQLSHGGLNVDLLTVEEVNHQSLGQVGRDFLAETAAAVESAALLYQGDLMDGWPSTWLADERERCRAVFLALAEKLCDYYESRGQVEATLAWGERILAADPAHERTHQRSMRVLYFAGDRTGALRQFQRCTTALSRELDVAPSPRTVALMERIRADVQDPAEFDSRTSARPPGEVVARLRRFTARLEWMIQDLDRDLSSVLGQQAPSEDRRTKGV
jgi:DNA-binding SARP family transcriptional activator